MLERRSSTYSFLTEKDMVSFFSNLLPKSKIENIIGISKKEFVIRNTSAEAETQLQFIRKCECKILRTIEEIKTAH